MVEQKYIALIDCDSFFVSCECKLNPRLKNKPVCVVSGDRGCVIARSKKAKKYGIPMGLPLFMAKEKYPKCIYLNTNHYNYSAISKEVMAILKKYSPTVEQYSIDEAFVDFTGLSKLYKLNYYRLAQKIRTEILEKVDIPVSIGVSRSKTLAKLASDKSKDLESHICIVGKKHIPKFLSTTSVDEVWGFGRKLAPKLQSLGIYTCTDYVKKDDNWIKTKFGKNGIETKYELLGNLIYKVTNERKLPQSISDTKSFSEFSSDFNFLKSELMIHIHNACRKLRKSECKCYVIGLILKTKDFQTLFVKQEIKTPTNFEIDISKVAIEELEQIYNSKVLYRSIGIYLDKFILCEDEQLGLFTDIEKKEKSEKLGKSLDKLEAKFGRNIVQTGFANKNTPIMPEFITKS